MKWNGDSLLYIILGILFSSNHNFHKSSAGLCFWASDPKIHLLKGLRGINKGHKNFYECCDLTKKVYLTYIFSTYTILAHCMVSTFVLITSTIV